MITEKQIRALNEVVYRAIIHSRMLANGAQYRIGTRLKKKWATQLSDLMDATHNIPNHLRAPEEADLDFLLLCLDGCDKKWSEEEGFPKLRQIYNDVMNS